jgi:hypothetical protein
MAAPSATADNTTTAVSAAAVGGASAYSPISPVRVLDTRIGVGARQGRVGAGRQIRVQVVPAAVASAAGVSRSLVTAVALNVTAVNPAGAGFVTVYPGDSNTLPPVSSLNMMRTGQTIANLVTTPVASDGTVNIYTATATDVVVDVQGVFVETASARSGRLEMITPRRVLDTRESSGQLRAGSRLTLKLNGIPSDASAVIANLTVTNTTGPGFVTAYPANRSRPDASNLNVNAPGETIANQVYVGLDNMSFAVYTRTRLDLIVDIVGYYTGSTAPSSPYGLFVPITPHRMLDTRNPSPASGFTRGALRQSETARLDVVGRGGVPARGVLAVASNITMTESGGPGHIRVWANGGIFPDTSAVNTSARGQTVANHAVAEVGSSGVNMYTPTSTHAIFDVTGYWTATESAQPVEPPPTTPTTTEPPPDNCRVCDLVGFIVEPRGGAPAGAKGLVQGEFWSNPTVAGCTFDIYLPMLPKLWKFNKGCTGTVGTVDFEYNMLDGSTQTFTFELVRSNL